MFWMKLKSIIKVSVERARTLNMLTDALNNGYQNMIKAIDEFHHSVAGIKEYVAIE